ncbi:MAG: hypothetical protein ACNA8R_08875, partial [Nitriliruptoraceae bacterium]
GGTEATGPDHIDVAPAAARGRARAARPVLAVADGVLWLVWERWEAAGGARLWAATSTDRGWTWSPPQLLDPGAPPGTQQQRAALVPASGGAVLVVFEDDRAGAARVLAVTVGAGGVSEAVRLDDAPAGAAARAPAVARVDAGAVVVWQDTRTGADRLRSVHVPI